MYKRQDLEKVAVIAMSRMSDVAPLGDCASRAVSAGSQSLRNGAVVDVADSEL